MATMGVCGLGRGTVCNAATINWGSTLHDPIVDRITSNVLDRLSADADAARGRWDSQACEDKPMTVSESQACSRVVAAEHPRC